MSSPFLGLPEGMIHCVTVNFSIVGCPGSLQEESTKWRRDFKDFLESQVPGAISRLRFDIAAVWAHKFGTDYPTEHLAPQFQRDSRLEIPAFNFHAHGIIFAPLNDRGGLKSALQKRYPGAYRVAVQRPTLIQNDTSGRASHGLQGWAEYAGMEKSNVTIFKPGEVRHGRLGHDAVSVSEDYVRLTIPWHRNSRTVKFGDHPDQVLLARRLYGDLKVIGHKVRKKLRPLWLRLMLTSSLMVNGEAYPVSLRQGAFKIGSMMSGDCSRCESPFNHYEINNNTMCYHGNLCFSGISSFAPRTAVSFGWNAVETRMKCSRPGIDKPP